MAERRMFAKTIIDSDAFLDMPVTARLLYYDLSMRADDDGFVNSPKKIMRMIGASQDDLSILALRKFIIPFDSGIVVIKHWKIHNYIRKDTYNATPYQDELAMLATDENKAYTLKNKELLTDRLLPVDEPSTQVRLGKDRLGKDKESKRFTAPTVTEVQEYITEKGYHMDAEAFVDFYTSKGWKVGSQPMKDWKAAVRNWNRRDREDKRPSKNNFNNFDQHDYNMDDLTRKAKRRMQ